VVPKVLQLVNSRQLGPTEQQSRKLPWLLKECHKFGLALDRIQISGDFQIMAEGILFTSLQHVLEDIQGGGQQPVVITVTKYSVIAPHNPAASSPLFQQSKQVLTVKAISYSRENCSLSHTICHGEGCGQLTIPPDIGSLVDIYEDEQSDENSRESSSKHFLEKKAV
jgi:hypothetical protein